MNPKAAKKTIMRRDLRESAIIAFGRWKTSLECCCVLALQHAKNNFETFYNILISAVDALLPTKKYEYELITLIVERQKALYTCGKDLAKYKQLRNRVQRECKSLCQGLEFLHGLTSCLTRLPASVSGRVEEGSSPVPQEFLVTPRIAYNALRCIKLKKSAGPDPFPNQVWKAFAFELSSVVCDLYNSLLT
ncbi:hypothetical protein P5673_006783, partial [Acropora cervicornis]